MPSYSREVSIPGRSPQELYDKVSQDIERFLAKGDMGKFDVARDPAQREVKVKSSMFSATLACLEGRIRVDAKLGLLAMPFRGKIDDGIDKWLSKAFPVETA